MPRPEYTGVSVNKELATTTEEFINNNPQLGYSSLTRFIEDAMRRHLEELKKQMKELPQFEQINSDENGVKILDRKIREVVQIYIKPQGIKCGFHQTNECEHIDFALKQKDVRETIRKHKHEGWKIP